MIGPTQCRILALVLGIWAALAPAVLVVPAAAMASQTSMAGEPRSGGCDGCPDTGPDPRNCVPMCLHVLPLATIAGNAAPAAMIGHDPWEAPRPAHSGRASGPELPPPKSVSIP
jgi:hypothetical protein